MNNYGIKVPKTEKPDATPYTEYYPHTIAHTKRMWDDSYYQVGSIDPGRRNYALRIEKRYKNGPIVPIVFDKVDIESFSLVNNITVCDTYKNLTILLLKYIKHFEQCHYIIIERQLPKNYKTVRIAQHTISLLMVKLMDNALLPSIIEVDSKLKGKMLGSTKGINDKQLKIWATEKGTELLHTRNDVFSLGVLDVYKKKRDDLCDTVCQAEALFTYWKLGAYLTKVSDNAPFLAQPNIILIPSSRNSIQ